MHGIIGHQRSSGRLELSWGAKGLRGLYQQAPLRALFPHPDPDEPATAALVNVAGGLAGGDSLDSTITLGAGSRLTITTPAAEKVYRTLGPATRIGATVRVGAGARLEWLPQEVILFDQAHLERQQDFSLAEGAELLLAEMLVFGRSARGEVFRQGQVLDTWRLRGPDGLLWADALAMDAEELADPFRFGGAQAMATVLLAMPGAETHLPVLRDIGAATVPRPGLLLGRALGEAGAVRDFVAQAVTALRQAAFGLPGALPRLWRC